MLRIKFMIKKMFNHHFNITALIFLWLISFQCFANQDSIQILWEKGNVSYTSQNYQEAIASYKKILNAGMESAKLYFNLGNAYYKTGDINNAILNYERAQILAPNNQDIAFNLDIANQFVVTEIDELPQPFFVRWKNNITNLYPADSWAKFSIITFLIFLILLGLFLFTKSNTTKKISFWIGILAILFSGLTFSFAARQKKQINHHNHAIIFCPRVTVKSAPAETSTDLFLLYEGVKIEISDSLDTWKEIKLPDGNVGWLPDSCIVKI